MTLLQDSYLWYIYIYIYIIIQGDISFSWRWRHYECDGVSNHRRLDCLRDCFFFRRRTKKTSKLRVTGLCEGTPPVTGGFPSQRPGNEENGSIWWRHHVNTYSGSQELYTRFTLCCRLVPFYPNPPPEIPGNQLWTIWVNNLFESTKNNNAISTTRTAAASTTITKHNETVCIFYVIRCICATSFWNLNKYSCVFVFVYRGGFSFSNGEHLY